MQAPKITYYDTEYFDPPAFDGINPDVLIQQAAGSARTRTLQEADDFQSANFITGSSGWRLRSNGNLEANTGNFRGDISGASGTFTGSITASSGTIGGFAIGADYVRDAANTFGLASTVTAGDDVRFWAGAAFASRATAPARITESGQAFFSNVYIGGTNIQYIATDQGIFSFGDGSDGAGVADGATALAGATLAANTYTLTRDVYYTNLTLSTGVTIKPSGYRIFGTGVLTLNGTGKITGDGGNGTNGTNGASGGAGGTTGTLADGYLKGSVGAAFGASGNGGTPAVNVGNAGSTFTGAAVSNSIGSSGASGGTGGKGGHCTGHSDSNGGTGVGGVATLSNVKLIANWHLATLLDVSSTGATVKFDNSGGPGGGGGGGGGDTQSGSGGWGGGGGGGGANGRIIAIYFRSISIGASASITAIGGNGGNGGNGQAGVGDTAGGGGGGGGAGGNGGQIILVYNVISNLGAISVTAGTKGTKGTGAAGAGTGTAGADGADGSDGNTGTIRQFLLSQ